MISGFLPSDPPPIRGGNAYFTERRTQELRTHSPDAIKTLTIELSDETAGRLATLADQLGVTPEEVAQVSIDDQLKRLGQEYKEAAEEVLSKNAELYRRLS